MLEIEVKIRLEDIAKVREAILRAGAKPEKERFSENNILFDDPSLVLTKKGAALRLRRAGKKAFLTYKGPRQKSRRFKIREEHESEVKNEKEMRRILKALGLQPVFSYHKQRAVYRKGRLKICLDETAVGDFCELEGERNEIIRFARALGFTRKDLIKADYIQLLKEGERKEA